MLKIAGSARTPDRLKRLAFIPLPLQGNHLKDMTHYGATLSVMTPETLTKVK